ncbi:peptidylprolyl isomerase [Vibrio cincinnatiensis]|uniref:peptidylprolyl isomerase n=1 Tax=Vibrio cincinnatiensis TaxID=675 RepID=UPI001EDDB379|nr:peptidylprolyl isomerase [Vibrio cincinnatiensis]MCG3726430.1 peptidylprolyl isomerase [Vibrio cincinnatiensis]
MMDRLREGVNSIAVKIILGLIILSFIFAGVGNYLISGGNNAAAKVGGIEISRGEFEQAYQNERNRMQAQFGDSFSNLLADPAYVSLFRKSVLDNLINDVLIEQHAQSLGLRVSDEQVRKMLLSMPEFQSAGRFDQEIYQSALRRAGFTPEGFAQYLRRNLVRNQLMTALQSSEFTLTGEVEAQNALMTQRREIRTITLPTASFTQSVELTDEEIEQYYQQNDERYTRPEQMRISYIELAAKKLKETIVISDEQVNAYYQTHQDKYTSNEQRKVSHILVQGDDESSAQAILDELNNGADFATLAKQKSQDVGSSREGGSLGWIERGTMDIAFENAAFSLQRVGDVTGLVKSEFGYHIIKLDELKAPVVQPLEQVAADIKADLQDQQAVDTFYQLQNELEKVAFESPDSLDEAAKVIHASIQRTDFVSANNIPELLRHPTVMQALQSPEVKDDGLNSEAIEIAPEHVIVVRIEESRPEIILPLSEVRESIETKLAQLKAEQQALALASQLVNELRTGDDHLLTEHNLTFSKSEIVDRDTPLAHVIFAMSKPDVDQTVYTQAKDQAGNVVVIALDKVETAADVRFHEPIAAQLARVGTQQDLNAVLGVLRQNTKIEYFAVSQ